MIDLIRYFDMFAGIGGFRAGLTRAGGFTCIGHCEIDKYANASYEAAHNPKESEVYYTDARTIEPDTMPDFDLLCGGFPCQSFSVAGKRKGFEDTRGTLFFEIARILRHKKPSYVLLENVPGLLSHDKGRTFSVILGTLCELGYCVEWTVLNSKDFGVPQSRRRVFIVCYLDPGCAGKILPVPNTNPKALVQLAGGPQGSRVYDAEGLACTQTSGAGGQGGKTGLYFVDNNKDIRFIDLCCGNPEITDHARCLTATYNNGLRYHKGEKSGAICMETLENHNQTPNAVFVDTAYGHPQVTKHARCITAHYAKSCMSAHKGEKSGVLEFDTAQAVLTPDREKVRQQGRRIKDEGEPMFTLTSQDKHGVLLIREATKKGYKEAHEGDTVDLGFIGSQTRKGRVGNNIAHTLNSSNTQGVVRYGRIRRLMPRECLRLQGFPEDMIDRILAITSDAQAYKQAGNAVTVNVIEAIGRRIKTVDDELKEGSAA